MILPSISEEHGLDALTDEDVRVLSVGISTVGRAEIRMAQLHPERHVTATTIDVQGARDALSEVESHELSDRITVKVEDVSKPLPYVDEVFDFIYARLVLHYLPKDDLDSALKELARVLKPGGKLFVVVRSARFLEMHKGKSSVDPETGLFTYTPVNDGKEYRRYFQTEKSIQDHLRKAWFAIESITSYEELLCVDFQRKKPSKHSVPLIEVHARRL